LIPLQYQDLNFVNMRGKDGMARVLDQIDRNKNLSKSYKAYKKRKET
jgi:hypothetical protein